MRASHADRITRKAAATEGSWPRRNRDPSGGKREHGAGAGRHGERVASSREGLDPRERYRLFLSRHLGLVPGAVRVEPRSIRGGLEAYEVAEVRVRYVERGRPRMRKVIVKHLGGAATREARVYEEVVSKHAAGMAPELVGVEWPREGHCDLYLGAVSRVRAWPWAREELVALVMDRLAELHALDPAVADSLPAWDYEAELRAGAAELELLLVSGSAPEVRRARRDLPAVRRLAESLPELRAQLLRVEPFGRVAIHGDVHAGNVVVARRAGRDVPLFLDWARARAGSPLEDVSSWLQSLGFWEAGVRRRHDSLWRRYLAARGMDTHLRSSWREAYWLAAGCNFLAGAASVHLRAAIASPPGSKARATAAAAARDCLRVIHRADVVWSGYRRDADRRQAPARA